MVVFDIITIAFATFSLDILWHIFLCEITLRLFKSQASTKIRLMAVFVVGVILIAHWMGYKVMGSAVTYDNRVGELIEIDSWRDIDNTIAEIQTTKGEEIKLEKISYPFLKKNALMQGLYMQNSGEILYYHRSNYCGNSFFSAIFPERKKKFRPVTVARLLGKLDQKRVIIQK